MANTFYTPEAVAKVAIGVLLPDLAIARTFNRDYEAEFKGGVGNVVNVKRPVTLTGRKRTYGATSVIVVDDVTEPTTVPVTITDMLYNAVKVTDEDLSLELEDFGRQVLAPQALAVARDIEAACVAEMQGLAETTTIAYDSAAPVKMFTAARKALRDIDVPPSGLWAAVGTGIAADLLNSNVLQDASQSGSSGALRDAVIGRVKGFEVAEVNTLADDEAIFYHGDAFTLVLRAPAVPEGASFGKSITANGFSLRYLRDYDASILADRSIVSTFIGTETMTKRRWDTGAYVTPAIRVLGSTTPA